MPRRDSHVAQELRDELRKLGRDVSTRQIERLGSAGLLGDPPHGSGLVQRALYALELVERNEGRLDLAVLAMFVQRRYGVSEQRLKAAYALALERLEVMIDKRLGPGDPVDAFRLPAATLARRSAKEAEGRELRERVRRRWPRDSGRTMLSLLEDFYLEVLLVARTGRASSEQGLREALEGTGVAAIASEHLPGRPPVVGALPLGEIGNLLSGLPLGGVARTAGLAPYQELEPGRDDALAFSEFARAFAPFVRRLFGLPDAFGLGPLVEASPAAIAFVSVGMLHLRRLLPRALDEARMMLERETPRFAARLELLDQIPEQLRGPLSDPERARDLDESERAELRAAIERFTAHQPRLYALATASD